MVAITCVRACRSTTPWRRERSGTWPNAAAPADPRSTRKRIFLILIPSISSVVVLVQEVRVRLLEVGLVFHSSRRRVVVPVELSRPGIGPRRGELLTTHD